MSFVRYISRNISQLLLRSIRALGAVQSSSFSSTSRSNSPKLAQHRSIMDLELGDSLGRGSFGVVKRGIWNSKEVAVKIYETESQKKSMKIELRTLSRVNHENIIQLLGYLDTEHPFMIIVEYAENGSLYDFLHPTYKPYYKYDARHAVNWALQCAQGVAYLHSMNPPIIHRDLKSPNLLLLKDRRRLKICDFGTARDRDLVMTINTGTAQWMAPEVFKSQQYTEKCDVYSWGIMFWEVLSRKRPFEEWQYQKPCILNFQTCQGIRPSHLDGCPAPFENLYTKCWQLEHSARPSMEHVVLIMSRLLLSFKEDTPINEETEDASKPVSFEGYDEELVERLDEKLEPQWKPITPDPNSNKSMHIFSEHKETSAVTETPHSIKGTISMDLNTIFPFSCKCKAGNGESCKPISSCVVVLQLVKRYFKVKKEIVLFSEEEESLEEELSRPADAKVQLIEELERRKERLVRQKKKLADLIGTSAGAR